MRNNIQISYQEYIIQKILNIFKIKIKYLNQKKLYPRKQSSSPTTFADREKSNGISVGDGQTPSGLSGCYNYVPQHPRRMCIVYRVSK